MKEYDYDELLHINTRGSKNDNNNSIHYHPYEPTSYSALEELLKNYEMKEFDTIVDFGCGKGRLNFFINYMVRAHCIGIEMNTEFLNEAIKNKKLYLQNRKQHGSLEFLCCYAQTYKIQSNENKFYFFNPFSVQVFMKVIQNIMISAEKSPREIDLILYYASDDYVFYLENYTSFELLKEIPLPGIYEKNPYERFLIYRLI